MFRRLFRRIKQLWAYGLIGPRDYYDDLQQYRKANPKSLEDEKKQILQWLGHVDAGRRAEQQGNREFQVSTKEKKLAEALYQMEEVARTAFMSHPAATEWDFRRCWPTIRAEMLKQHALEELAANPALSECFSKEAAASNSDAFYFHGTNLHRKD